MNSLERKVKFYCYVMTLWRLVARFYKSKLDFTILRCIHIYKIKPNHLSRWLASLSSIENNKNYMSSPKYSLLTYVQIQARKCCTSGHFQQNHLAINSWKTVTKSFCFFSHQPFFSIFISILVCTQKHQCLDKICCSIWNVHDQVSTTKNSKRLILAAVWLG